MKNLFTILAALLIFSGSAVANNFADNHKDKSTPAKESSAEAAVLKGTVVDSQTLESLAGVSLEIEGKNIVIYTDFEGNFTIEELEPGYYNIIIRYVSYQGHLIENVYLTQGVNSLHQIKLISN